MEKWIKVQALDKTLGKSSLNQLTLQLGTGVTALIGSNGAGKTTLLRCLSTFYYPDAGKVKYGGVDVHKAKEAYCYVLGYLPQEFGGYEHMTCRTFLQYMAALKMLPSSIVNDRITYVLDLLNLEPYEDIRLGQISPGILRRLGLAQALLNDPEVLLLDEPTSGLDPVERKLVLNILRDLGDNRIVVFATNALSDVEDIADDVIILQAGRMLVHEKTHDIVNLVQGLIWQGVTTDLDESSNYITISRVCLEATMDPPSAQVRVISSRYPFENAKPVRPNFEDAYIGIINGVIQV